MTELVAVYCHVRYDLGMWPSDIRPEDGRLAGHHTWQVVPNDGMAEQAGREILLVRNGDAAPFEGKSGIEVIRGEVEIDKRLQAEFRIDKMTVVDRGRLTLALFDKGISVEDADNMTTIELRDTVGKTNVNELARLIIEPVAARDVAMRAGMIPKVFA